MFSSSSTYIYSIVTIIIRQKVDGCSKVVLVLVDNLNPLNHIGSERCGGHWQLIPILTVSSCEEQQKKTYLYFNYWNKVCSLTTFVCIVFYYFYFVRSLE
jgi:hypothetical protein